MLGPGDIFAGYNVGQGHFRHLCIEARNFSPLLVLSMEFKALHSVQTKDLVKEPTALGTRLHKRE